MRTTNTDITIRFARSYGYGLDKATKLVKNCDRDYVAWLEDRIEMLLEHIEDLTRTM